ncbi:MAG: histidine kinase [Gallionella sp.]|nr:histidine kinase [Gallionella sp.]
MFKLLRFYSVTSFIIIFLTAALLTLFYRQVTMHWIEHLAKTNNLAVAQTALNFVGPELATYLESVPDAGERGIGSHGLPAELAAHIRRVMQDTTVSRIEIYNRNGLLIFSTHTTPTAPPQARNPGFLAALGGRVSGSMVFMDTFDRLAGTAATDNLMQTYTPIRSGPTVLGVFETHTDMSHLIEESDRVMFSILVGAELILALLYAILFFVVRHAKNIITAQQKTILERTASLKILSENLLRSEESSKKKIATDLHEGLAQTLSAIKINVENTELTKAYGANTQSLEAIVPVLQNAIHEVRAIATELRPSSLDDLGLLPTINWFCREFEQRHPKIRIQREISLQEHKIPSQLKIVIYRIIESAFKNIAKYSSTDQIRFVLHQADDMIHLIIGDTPAMQPAVATIARFAPGSGPQLRFAEIKERTSLSGGVFSTRMKKTGWVTLHSSWACANY